MCEDVVIVAVISSMAIGFMFGCMVQETFDRRGRKK
jgi:uncharacterized membrane protein